jgi:uncharacterized membrane protein YfbV (UPF0208 family)
MMEGLAWVDRAQRRTILFRDISCTVMGILGLVWQTVMVDEASGALVSASVSLLLAPTGAALWAQRNSAGQGTTGSSTGPPEQPLPERQPLS